MNDLSIAFAPPRRKGIITHAILAIISATAGGLLLLLAFDQPGRSLFILWIILSLVFIAPLPVILYQGYALYRALYYLERDGLRLRWGLRIEDIPIPDIEWIRPASEMGFHLPLPLINFPGAILGTRVIEGLGPVEYLASEQDTLLLIATPKKIYAINPRNPGEFIRAYRKVSEMGSLSPISSSSERTINFFRLVWTNKFLRTVFIGSFWLNVLLFALVNVTISQHTSISLGFNPDGSIVTPGPPEQLFLFPFLSIFTFIFDFLTSLFFFHRRNQNSVAYLFCACSLITPILLIITTLFII